MAILTVNLTLEFNSPPVFHLWLPMEADQDIVLRQNGIELKLYFRPQSTWWAFRDTPERIRKTHNNSAHRIFIEANVEISSQLESYIRNPDSEIRCPFQEYKLLGRSLQSVIVERVNRFISYARSVKGQYWIDEFQPDDANPGQFFRKHKTEAWIGEVKVRFDPDQVIEFVVTQLDREKMFCAEDWADVKTYVASENRTPLVKSLLANARSLNAKGHRRNALVDAVTALEISLNRFANKASATLLSKFGERLESKNIKALVDKVGFRGSFGIVLPMIFDSSEFPTSLLDTCRDAIDHRNDVVHHGVRDIEKQRLGKWLTAIENACLVLEQWTEVDRSSELDA